MAKKKEQKKAKQVTMVRRRKKRMSAKKVIVLTFLGVLALIFSATTVILFFGIMPTIGAFLADRTRKKSQALTVAAMNLAGCSPFLMKLWLSNHVNDVDVAFNIISDVRHITVIYGLALAGYAISFAVTGVVSSVLLERGKKRLIKMDAEKKKLEDRWGPEVTGQFELDENGFAKAGANNPVPPDQGG